MNSQDYYYLVEPIEKKVTEHEFYEFISSYPRPLVRDCCGISDPPAISYNDFELADRWPYSVVASTFAYSDDPDNYYYEAEENRVYRIMSNYKEVFKSRTGNKTNDSKLENNYTHSFVVTEKEQGWNVKAD